MRQVILDTETTGLSHKEGDRVIEIGCVEMISRRLTGRVFHEYLNPGREISAGAMQVHGISNAFLKDKPTFETISESFKEFIAGAELVIHNAPFDVGFLDNEFVVTKNEWTSLSAHCSVLDTLALARKMHPGQKNNLDALCKRYHVNTSHRVVHGALLDAEILAEVYLLMTGGQTLLNLEVESPIQARTQVEQSSVNLKALPVIKATEEELSAHQQFLIKTLKKKVELPEERALPSES
jgi:DNA polymerase-3 subunit epsilon